LDFSLSEEQELIKDSVDKYFSGQSIENHSLAHWQTFSELGWLAMPFTEEQGGYGGNIVDICLLMAGIGKHRFNSPFFSSTVVASKLLASAPESPQRDRLLDASLTGNAVLSLAVFESGQFDEIATLNCRAQAQGADWILEGKKVFVPALRYSDIDTEAYLVVAKVDDLLSLFVVRKGAPGLITKTITMMDGSQVENLVLDNVKLTADDRLSLHDCASDIELILSEAVVALSAEAVGAMDALLQHTLEYVKTRSQFGAKISSFQALQHRLVDMYSNTELCRAMLTKAQCAILESSDDQKSVIAALKLLVGKLGRIVAEESVQLHGGMGFSNEMPIGSYLKRLMCIDASFGGVEIQRKKFCDLQYAALHS
jgi:alkylation response protein AidB-like acyl-CoA dehydrogenase